eukprot:m.35477 g.35477  ORF g.35477 m.35477 type:complete len:82 (-) comp8886_c0_seq1:66-311(-)
MNNKTCNIIRAEHAGVKRNAVYVKLSSYLGELVLNFIPLKIVQPANIEQQNEPLSERVTYSNRGKEDSLSICICTSIISAT